MKPHNPPLLLAQFKAYHSLEETLKTIQTLITEQTASKLRLHFSVPYSFLEPLSKQLATGEALIGAEMMLNADSGAFTATVAGKMLTKAGAKFVLIGDIDERKTYAPTPGNIKNKILHALETGIMPIVCIGETLEQFHEGRSKEFLQTELVESLGELSAEQLRGLHILYDAPWINRKPWEAASEELQSAYHMVREAINEIFIDEVACEFKIIYAVPTFSDDLPELMKSLPASGYSLGVLTSTAAELSHLIPPLAFYEDRSKDEGSSDRETAIEEAEIEKEPVAKKPRKRSAPKQEEVENLEEDKQLEPIQAKPKRKRRSRKTADEGSLAEESNEEEKSAAKTPKKPRTKRGVSKITDLVADMDGYIS